MALGKNESNGVQHVEPTVQTCKSKIFFHIPKCVPKMFLISFKITLKKKKYQGIHGIFLTKKIMILFFLVNYSRNLSMQGNTI